ncbi:MAG: hypothetical protein HC882_00685 [Acidobacteria bacterium]|nr:hypothetical protein [Acidobacteriota bacterium]
MQQHTRGRPMLFSTLSICTSAALVGAAYWLTTSGSGAFNSFNDRVFGPYFTAGAILMIAFYSLVFFAAIGVAVVATIIAWIRGESPRWLTWTATITTVAAPVVVVNLLRGA